VGTLFIPFDSAQPTTRRLITYCWDHIETFHRDESDDSDVALGKDGISLHLRPWGEDAKLSVQRGERTIFTCLVDDYSCNAVVLWSPDGKAFALNYSDGGSYGGFCVLLFVINGDNVTDVSHAIEPAVNDFRSRHFCKSRGQNNVMSLKWLPDSMELVLMTQVFPRSDCGPDLGHTEGYVVTVPGGKIKRHLTLNQLKNLPGICLENAERN
jgi:hypothetical protein